MYGTTRDPLGIWVAWDWRQIRTPVQYVGVVLLTANMWVAWVCSFAGAAIAPPPMLVGTIGDPAAVAPKNTVLFGAKKPRETTPRTDIPTDDAFVDPFANLPVAGYNAADTGSTGAVAVQPSDSFATKAASIGGYGTVVAS